MRYRSQSGKTSQLFVIIVAALLLLLIVFALSKLIPHGALPSVPKPSPSPSEATAQEGQPKSPANTYTNAEYDFSLTLPQDWEARENIASALPHRLFFIGFGEKGQADISTSVEIKDQPADQVIKDFRTEVSQSSTSSVALEREVRLGKQYIKQITVRHDSSSTNIYFRFAEKDAKTYILSSPDSKLLDSFTFTTASD